MLEWYKVGEIMKIMKYGLITFFILSFIFIFLLLILLYSFFESTFPNISYFSYFVKFLRKPNVESFIVNEQKRTLITFALI